MSLPQSFEGKFEVLHKISEGGMGAVYKVRHVLLDEIRVIKVIRPQHEDDENLKARFHREARVATRLRHPNIAVMYDFSIGDGGTAYIVMEFIDGKTLHEILLASGPPPLDQTLEIAHQSLDALSYLHGQGYVHRDISPDNLMLTRGHDRDLLVKLIDLGVAKRVGGGHELTSTGMFLGKVRYSSPEQFGAGKPDQRSDIYSFGVMLYELLTGRIPIQGEDFPSLVGGHLYRPVLSFELTDPEGRIPPGLRRVVLKALEKDAGDRIGSAAELAEMLAPFRDGSALRETVIVDETQGTVLLDEEFAGSLPTGLVSEAMRRIDELVDAGRLEEAELQLTATVGEVGEVDYLRGLREKLERARTRRPAPIEPARTQAELDETSEIAATVLTRATAAGAAAPPPGRTARKQVALVVAATALALAVVVWVLLQAPGLIPAAVPIAEETYLLARDRIEDGDVEGVRRVLRQVIEADPAEDAEHEWVTAGEDGPYLPYFYLGLANARSYDCVAAVEAWSESERQGEVQKTAAHAELLAERGKCDALYDEAITRLEARLEEGEGYAGLLEPATTDPGFADLWRRSPELREQILGALSDYRALRPRLEQARSGGFGAALKLEPDVLAAVEELKELADRVLEMG